MPDTTTATTCTGCRDGAAACRTCETFRVTGSSEAAAGCVVRLTDLGWRFHTDQVEVAPGVWESRVSRPTGAARPGA